MGQRLYWIDSLCIIRLPKELIIYQTKDMTKKKEKNSINRRQFLGYSALGIVGLTILPSWRIADGTRIAPSDRVILGLKNLI